MHFHVAKAPVLSFTMTALLAAGEPFPQLFALAGLSSIPNDDEVLVFAANFSPCNVYLCWQWHSTQIAVELTVVANIFPITTPATFHDDCKHSMPQTIWPSKVPTSPLRQLKTEKHNKHIAARASTVDTMDLSLQVCSFSKLLSTHTADGSCMCWSDSSMSSNPSPPSWPCYPAVGDSRQYKQALSPVSSPNQKQPWHNAARAQSGLCCHPTNNCQLPIRNGKSCQHRWQNFQTCPRTMYKQSTSMQIDSYPHSSPWQWINLTDTPTKPANSGPSQNHTTTTPINSPPFQWYHYHFPHGAILATYANLSLTVVGTDNTGSQSPLCDTQQLDPAADGWAWTAHPSINCFYLYYACTPIPKPLASPTPECHYLGLDDTSNSTATPCTAGKFSCHPLHILLYVVTTPTQVL